MVAPKIRVGFDSAQDVATELAAERVPYVSFGRPVIQPEGYSKVLI
jgi:hypothetical protein